MDEPLSLFLSAQTLLLCLGTYVVTFVVRRIVEAFRPTVKANHYYRELFLPLGPIANGALLALILPTWMPELVATSVAGVMLYGAIAGLFSAFLYTRIRSWVRAKTS
jgi:hypothetical protein